MIDELINKDKFKVITCGNEAQWLQTRKFGGTSASIILGENKYKDKKTLYREIKGLQHDDFKGNEFTEYGKGAEPHIRAMFRLDHPEYEVYDPPVIIEVLESIDYPFMTATLDGMLIEKETGRKGILEIKTVAINNAMQEQDWENAIPQNYFCQVLHYLAVTGYDFADLCFEKRYQRDKEKWAIRKSVHIERREVEEDIKYLIAKEKDFYENNILKNIEPDTTIRFDL